MIVSHQHRFIFLRTEKTGGTSVQLALAELCGPDDIISASKYHRNRDRGLGRYVRLPATIRHAIPQWTGFHAHLSAAHIRRMVGEDVWRSYYKFAIERNPWDRQVSLFFHRRSRSQQKASFDQWLGSPISPLIHHVRLDNWAKYAIDGKVVADEVINYEELPVRLAAVARELGISSDLKLPRIRSEHRPARAYRELYTAQTRDIVSRWYANEITAFGFEF